MPALKNPRHEQFAQLVATGVKVSDAYRKACKPRTKKDKTIHENASRLAASAKVAPRIAELSVKVGEIIEEKFGITAERIAAELAKLAFFSPLDLYDAEGNLIPTNKLPREVAAALQQIEVVEMAGGAAVGGEEGIKHVALHTKKVKWHDKRAALETLGRWKNIGMWIDQKVTGAPGDFGLPRTPEETDTLLARVRAERARRLGKPALVAVAAKK